MQPASLSKVDGRHANPLSSIVPSVIFLYGVSPKVADFRATVVEAAANQCVTVLIGELKVRCWSVRRPLLNKRR